MASYDLSLPRVKPPTTTASEASLSAHIARFAARLRSHGIELSLSDEVDGLLALQLVDIRTEEEVFLALRTALKVNRQHWSIFNLIFDQMWRHAESLTAFPEPRENERKTTISASKRVKLSLRVLSFRDTHPFELGSCKNCSHSDVAGRGGQPSFAIRSSLRLFILLKNSKF